MNPNWRAILSVAHDAEESGLVEKARELRARIDVEFERTRRSAGARIAKFEGRVERAQRRDANPIGPTVWREYMRWLNDPTACLRRPLPYRPHGLHLLGAAQELHAGDPVVRDSNGHARLARQGERPAGVMVSDMDAANRIGVRWNESATTPIADLLAYGAAQMLKPPVYRPPPMSTEVYAELQRRGLISEPQPRRPSKPERRLARRNRSRK